MVVAKKTGTYWKVAWWLLKKGTYKKVAWWLLRKKVLTRKLHGDC